MDVFKSSLSLLQFVFALVSMSKLGKSTRVYPCFCSESPDLIAYYARKLWAKLLTFVRGANCGRAELFLAARREEENKKECATVALLFAEWRAQRVRPVSNAQ